MENKNKQNPKTYLTPIVHRCRSLSFRKPKKSQIHDSSQSLNVQSVNSSILPFIPAQSNDTPIKSESKVIPINTRQLHDHVYIEPFNHPIQRCSSFLILSTHNKKQTTPLKQQPIPLARNFTHEELFKMFKKSSSKERIFIINNRE